MIAAGKRPHEQLDGVDFTAGASDVARAGGETEIDKLHSKIEQLVAERDFFGQSLRSMSVNRRRGMVEALHPDLSVTAKCRVLSISRSSFYNAPQPEPV